MPESLLGGALGGEEQNPEVERPEALAGAEAFAAAVAAIASRQDPQVARDTSTFLSKQSRLLDIQAKHLEEEHEARLHFLRGQAREVDIRRLGLRLRVGFQLFIVLVATVIGIFGAVLIHDAVTSRSVVIEPFETPRALAERGLTGTVVASGVLDQLTRLQAATRSALQRRDLSNAWSKQLKLTVPEAGISIGEISQLLKARFSHDIHISGDLTQTAAGGLEITVRGDGLVPRTFADASNQVAKLTTDAAEYVYARSQPALWATYLVDTGRFQEAIDFCQASIGSAARNDQAIVLTNWAVALAKSGSASDGLSLLRQAVDIQPDYWTAYDQLMNLQALLGDEEGAMKTAEQVRKVAGGRPGRAPELTYAATDGFSWDLPAQLDELTAYAHAPLGADFTYSAGPSVARVEALLHDPVAAQFTLRKTAPDPNDRTILPSIQFVRGLLATEAGEFKQAVIEMEGFSAAYSDPAVVWADYGFNCWVAPVEEAAGHPEKADAVLKTGGTFVDCYRFHGDILDARGDWASAQKAYADAVALAPDLPAGYYSWGVALAKHGDLAGAEAKLKEANQRGPHWADPLKAWGDVLVKQAKIKEALAKYDEALKYAPNWKQLKEAREAAAKQKT